MRLLKHVGRGIEIKRVRPSKASEPKKGFIDKNGLEQGNYSANLSDDVKLSLISIHLSHCEACIFPVRALKFPYVYYTPLYHKRRNNTLHLTGPFVPVSLTREVFEPLQAVRYLERSLYLQA